MYLDKFYTKKEVAQECIDLIPDFGKYDLIVEPSAGNGAFSTLIKCQAYDIEPEADGITKKDWFEVKKLNGEHILVIGNPPFGERSKSAKSFIRHSIALDVETIAFILPDTFGKLSNQSVFPKEWRLIIEHKISDCHFSTKEGEYYVPCSFYVWTREAGSKNLRQRKAPPTSDFMFLSCGDVSADFSINGNSGRVKELSQITNPKAEHYIKARNKSVSELKDIFTTISYPFKSSCNGGNAWISQQDILKAYYDLTTS
mgnify:FL=1